MSSVLRFLLYLHYTLYIHKSKHCDLKLCGRLILCGGGGGWMWLLEVGIQNEYQPPRLWQFTRLAEESNSKKDNRNQVSARRLDFF